MARLLYVYDLSHETEIYESVIFYFVYFIIEFYIAVICGFIFFMIFDLSELTTKQRLNVEVYLFLFTPAVIPFIFCSILSAIIMIKKKIYKESMICLTVIALFLTLLSPNIIGMFSGLIMPAILMTFADNSVEKYDKILKLKLAEQDRKIEMQLEKEQIIKKINES